MGEIPGSKYLQQCAFNRHAGHHLVQWMKCTIRNESTQNHRILLKFQTILYILYN